MNKPRLAANVQWAVDGQKHDTNAPIPALPAFKTLQCRVLARFRYADEQVINGRLVVSGSARTVEPGTILSSVLEPNARSWAACGFVEIL